MAVWTRLESRFIEICDFIYKSRSLEELQKSEIFYSSDLATRGLLQKKRAPEKSEALVSFLAVWTRLELATPGVTGRYSNQLNYQTIVQMRMQINMILLKLPNIY